MDAHAFTRLSRQARAAHAEGATATADALFRRALGLWRGPALAEVDTPWAKTEADRLEAERLSVLEDHAELRLAAGDHRAVACELAAHVRAHPLRERPAAQLMLACTATRGRPRRSRSTIACGGSWSRNWASSPAPNCAASTRLSSSRIRCSTWRPRRRRRRTGASPRPSCPPIPGRSRRGPAEIERLHADLVNAAAVTVINGPRRHRQVRARRTRRPRCRQALTDGVIYVNLHGLHRPGSTP
ncbi:hypothetical protein GCM10020219_075760 [Nonomuraea dietziae]